MLDALHTHRPRIVVIGGELDCRLSSRICGTGMLISRQLSLSLMMEVPQEFFEIILTLCRLEISET